MEFDDFDVGDIIITRYSIGAYGKNNFAIHCIETIAKTMRNIKLICTVLLDASGVYQPGRREAFIPTDTYIESVKVLFKKRGDEYAV